MVHIEQKNSKLLRSLHYDLTQARGNIGDPWENRTPDAGVRGRSLNRLTNGPYNAELQHIKKNRSEQKYICPLREIWCTIGDSNPGPTDQESVALPSELMVHRCRQHPILPGRYHPSIFGEEELNYCVRHGNRCDLNSNATD